MTAAAQQTAGAVQAGYPSLAEFESAALDPEKFDHEAHVHIAWLLLDEEQLPEATQRFTDALRRLTSRFGIEGKYHETISCFFMALIAERKSHQAHSGWAAFAAENPDLLVKSEELLDRYYSRERLWSPLARQQFLLPDRDERIFVHPVLELGQRRVAGDYRTTRARRGS